jgi:tetratricopeptide (TPR) repeat protein
MMPVVHADSVPDFYSADTATYGYYQRQQWDKLIKAGNGYVKYGFDYYYMRMRIGASYFEKRNYLQAIPHFQKALEHNSGDPVAQKYLYSCYKNTGRDSDADRILPGLPPDTQEELSDNDLSFIDDVYLETGPLISSGKTTNSNLDLDGIDDVYGELDLTRDSYYQAFGLRPRLTPWLRINMAYIGIIQSKTKQIMITDSLVVNDDYYLYQHQFYFSPALRFKHGISVTPAFHYLKVRFTAINDYYDNEITDYRFEPDTFNLNNYIGSLAISKDLSIFTLGAGGAAAYLNGRNHYQAEASVMVFPEGNIDLYAQSSFTVHFTEQPAEGGQQPAVSGRMEQDFIFSQMIGIRLFGGAWLEGSASFGEVIEYFDKNSYIVYNLPEKILFKWGVQGYYKINDKILLGLKYDNLYREHFYISYISNQPDDLGYEPGFVYYNYNQHILIASIKWNL